MKLPLLQNFVVEQKKWISGKWEQMAKAIRLILTRAVE